MQGKEDASKTSKKKDGEKKTEDVKHGLVHKSATINILD